MSVDNLSLETGKTDTAGSVISKVVKVPNVAMVETERGLRGKGNEGKKVKFQAIVEGPRPDNPLDAALELSKQDAQVFWDNFVRGYNESAYEAVADPIAAFLEPSWNDDKQKNFRMSVNAMAKFLGKDKETIAEALKAQMEAEPESATETIAE